MILDNILETVRRCLEEKKRENPLPEIMQQLPDQPAPKDFAGALKKAGFGLIAEIKKASPAKGWLHEELDIANQARLYERGGASAISVLTEPDFFKGSLEDLKLIRRTVMLPLLRKDFILEPYQVYEARLYGADAVLLIAAVLSPGSLRELLSLTYQLKMAALVEIHSEPELNQAIQSGATIIGINNRDLSDFSVDLQTTLKLRPLIPPDVLVVSESGIATGADAAKLKAAGVSAILVGEAVITAHDPVRKIRELLSVAAFHRGNHKISRD